MPTVLERPELIETRPPELEPPRRPVRSFRWLRWAGWLLAAGAVVLVVVFAMNATSDDGVVADPATVPDHLVVADPATATDRLVAAVTADPKLRTPAPGAPVPDVEPRLGFEKEATATPLHPTQRFTPDVEPLLGFDKEATVTPVNR